MSISQLLLRLAIFIIIGFLCVGTSWQIVRYIEDSSVLETREVLIDSGNEWASVVADGLHVILEGEAPSEAARFRATAAAGRAVDANRVIDDISVAASLAQDKPNFAIEILRNDRGVSLIGLIPTSTSREALTARVTSFANSKGVSDLLAEADYTPKETWSSALDYALEALEDLPQSKISVNETSVLIEAIANSEAQKSELETSLASRRPDGIRISIKITAPRPVISPFITRFTLEDGLSRFDACAAETQSAKTEIMTAARSVGYTGPDQCSFGLGSPSKSWGQAVAQSINTLGQLKGGTVTISNTDITLIAKGNISQAEFDRTIGSLENRLPDAFALTAEHPQAQDSHADGHSTFTASLTPENGVEIGGRLPDELSVSMVKNLALAKFTSKEVNISARVVDDLPPLWSLRALSAIEALSKLHNGAVLVTASSLNIKGRTGQKSARVDISKLLLSKLGDGVKFDLDITYDDSLNSISSLPTPQECISRISSITKKTKIRFDAGSKSISSATLPIIDKIAGLLKLCVGLKMEIAGYTDSKGSEKLNTKLSQQRAQSILNALKVRRIPISGFKAVGYGEADPIGDNETDAGREANRRIEFRLIQTP